MSLDQLAVQLRAFEDALSQFAEVMRGARAEDAAAQEQLASGWDDQFAHEFRRRYAEYAEPLRRLCESDLGHYLEFIERKRHQVEEYLRG